MAHTNEKAVSAPPGTAQDTAHGTDFITTVASLKKPGSSEHLRLIKRIKADGTIEPYDNTNAHKTSFRRLNGTRDIAHVIQSELEGCYYRAAIRGGFVGGENVLPENNSRKDGSVLRKGTYCRNQFNFPDVPHYWVMLDVDSYSGCTVVPAEQGEAASLEFIKKELPACFHDVTFFWQLSSSAGTKGNENVLKAHLWFWLSEKRDSPELKAWAEHLNRQAGRKLIDPVVFQPVQLHYCAAPVLDDGVEDPVSCRSGLWESPRGAEEVILDIPCEVLSRAAERRERAASEVDLKDQSPKPGHVGLFYRTFSWEDVVYEILDGEFEEGSGEGRLTWMNADSGAPDGAWIAGYCEHHIGANHNSWPWGANRTVSLFDCVRYFLHGQEDVGADDFALDDIRTTPSYLAMCKWMDDHPAVQKQKEIEGQERMGAVDQMLAEIAAETDTSKLEGDIAERVRALEGVSLVDREQFAKALQVRIKDLSGISPPIKDVRRLVESGRARQQATSDDAPKWAKGFCWVVSRDAFVETTTKQVYSKTSYNAAFNRRMHQFADKDGRMPDAADYALAQWDVKVLDSEEYNPRAELFFQRDGLNMLNTYRPDLLPEMPESYTPAELEAIQAVECHAKLLIPDPIGRAVLLDFLAYCVQKPGSKVRWAPLIIGMEGDGKTAFITLMGCILGSRNIRVLDSTTLEKSDFSGWSSGQCFTGVEEIKLHGDNRHDTYNKLKPYISNDVAEVHRKGKDPYNVPNTTNYLFLTNYPDAVPVTDNDRRILFLRSPHRNKDDLNNAIVKDTGLGPADYFERLFDRSIKAHPGALRKWLMERKVSEEFDPNGRAFETATRADAIDLARSEEELLIEGAIAEGGRGIYETLVAGGLLSEALAARGHRIRTTKLAQSLARLGFTSIPKPVKWGKKPYRWYYRGVMPEHPAAAASDFERARLDDEIEGEFVD